MANNRDNAVDMYF